LVDSESLPNHPKLSLHFGFKVPQDLLCAWIASGAREVTSSTSTTGLPSWRTNFIFPAFPPVSLLAISRHRAPEDSRPECMGM
jgi:hypothetical protein